MDQPFLALKPEARHRWRSLPETIAFRQQIEALRAHHDANARSFNLSGKSIEATVEAARSDGLSKVLEELATDPPRQIPEQDAIDDDPAERPSLRRQRLARGAKDDVEL